MRLLEILLLTLGGLWQGFRQDFNLLEIVLIAGGLFLIAKATHEIHAEVETQDDEAQDARRSGAFFWVILQIVVVDIVFSLDSFITAIGMAQDLEIMIAAVVIEHVAGAMGNIALVALIMALCDLRFSAFQYALLSAIALLPRYSLGYPAGWIADHGGWYTYYVVSFLIALPGLALVWAKRDAIT